MNGRYVGIDVGGTKCLGVAADANGNILAEQRIPTPKSPDEIIAVLVQIAKALNAEGTIGIGVPGLVTRDGVLKAAPNLVGVANWPVGALVSAQLGMPVEVDNDATCAAAAEWKWGAAAGSTEMVLVTLGTGIGGGIVATGVLQRGANGFAGEVGHMVVDPNGPDCPCGRKGCWERFASGSGLGREAREAAAAHQLDRVVELAGGSVDAVRGELVVTAAREGDAQALAVLDGFAKWVALGLVNLTNILDPALFVIGGGLAEASDVLLAPIQKWFTELLYAPTLRPHPGLAFAKLGPHAGALGAAILSEVH